MRIDPARAANINAFNQHSMQTPFVTRSRLALFACASLITLAACGGGDVGASKLKKAHSGMPRDSVLELMGTGTVAATGGDSSRVVNGFRHQRFLMNAQMFEILWYRETPGSVTEPILKEVETPVVLAGDTVAGWGWKYYADQGLKLGLPDVMKINQMNATADSARKADSTARANAAPAPGGMQGGVQGGAPDSTKKTP